MLKQLNRLLLQRPPLKEQTLAKRGPEDHQAANPTALCSLLLALALAQVQECVSEGKAARH